VDEKLKGIPAELRRKFSGLFASTGNEKLQSLT